jgi:hypothetical protein
MLIFLIAAFLGLMVLIDGLLKGEVLRPLLGLAACALFVWMAFWGVPYLSAKFDRKMAEQMATAGTRRSWPMVFASVLFGLIAFACAVAILVVPFEALIDWSRQSAGLVRGLETGFGQSGARLALSALFFTASGAAFWGAWTWYQSGAEGD